MSASQAGYFRFGSVAVLRDRQKTAKSCRSVQAEVGRKLSSHIALTENGDELIALNINHGDLLHYDENNIVAIEN
jgi:hypothetical protein